MAHDHDALAAATADAQTDFDHAWNDRNCVSAFEQPGRNVLFRHGHQLIQNLSRGEESCVLSLTGNGRESEGQRHQHHYALRDKEFNSHRLAEPLEQERTGTSA